METYTELLDTSCVMEVAAAGLLIMNKERRKEYACLAGDWIEFLDRMKHAIVCDNYTGCPFHATPTLLDVVRKAVELVFVPTREGLKAEQGADGAMYLDFWLEFEPFLGISEETIRERYRRERQCCNLTCPFRFSGVLLSKKYTCAKCQYVFYCNRECQKRSVWIFSQQ